MTGRRVASLCRIRGADARIVLRDVTVRYGQHLALEAVSGEFTRGSMTAVVGANGAGKSTLLAAIAGVVPLARGVINCAARPRLAYLPQHAAVDRDYPVTLPTACHDATNHSRGSPGTATPRATPTGS